MQDSPDKTMLLAGVARFLKEEVLPNTADRGRAFRVRIAAHLVASVARELQGGEAHDVAEGQRLAALLGEDVPEGGSESQRRTSLTALNARLADGIRHGDPQIDIHAARAHVMETLKDKLAINQPRFDTRLNPEVPEA